MKGLATQTTKATEEIAGQVRAMQDATNASAQAIVEITETINRVKEISAVIATSVEEQGTATQEISSNIQQASQGAIEVSSNISGVTEAAQQTSAGSTQVLGAALELAANNARLRQEVEAFLSEVPPLKTCMARLKTGGPPNGRHTGKLSFVKAYNQATP